jgi:hypothetical protein
MTCNCNLNGGMALTAEQVEDVRTAREELRGYRNYERHHVNQLIAAVDALFPATEPAEEAASSDGDCFDVCEGHPIEDLIAKSSLGTESAQALINTVSPEHGRRVAQEAARRAAVQRSNEVIALAKFMYAHGKPELSDEDREILGPWEGLDEVAQTIWINLAGAAYDHFAGRTNSVNAVHVHHHDMEAHAASFNEGYEAATRQAMHLLSADDEETPNKCLDPLGDDCWEGCVGHRPAPVGSAEEETKAVTFDEIAQSLKSIGDAESSFGFNLRFWRRIAEKLIAKYPHLTSSPVVPAPTETGPWQRIEDVPANVTVLDCDGLSWSYVDSHWRCHEDVDGPYSLRLINDLAPFVAAKEG